MTGIGRRKDGGAEPRSQCGGDHRAVSRAGRRQESEYSVVGPGKDDPRYNQDGKSTPLVLPPAYGLAQIKNETYTAEGPISYWNAYVAVTQMGGQLLRPAARDRRQAFAGHGHVQAAGAARLPAQPPGASTSAGSFDAAIAERGRTVL